MLFLTCKFVVFYILLFCMYLSQLLFKNMWSNDLFQQSLFQRTPVDLVNYLT